MSDPCKANEDFIKDCFNPNMGKWEDTKLDTEYYWIYENCVPLIVNTVHQVVFRFIDNGEISIVFYGARRNDSIER